MNASPLNPVLDPLKTFWMTPWDPVYDIPDRTVVVYYRISPIGVAYIDRFMPYYDSNGVLQVSWEEGVQLAAWSWGVLGMGTPAINPPIPTPVSFANAFLGGANVDDLARSVRMKSSSISVEEMFNDVKALIPATASILTSPNMKPCNDGLWLMNEIHETPCGPFDTYNPSIGAGPHFGPPANRTGYKTGGGSTFAPDEVGIILPVSVSEGLRFNWAGVPGASGYNFAVFDTTTGGSGSFVDGGMTTQQGYTFAAVPAHWYTIYVSAYNDMGVSPSTNIKVRYAPLGPPDTTLCGYEGDSCFVSTAAYISYGTKGNFRTVLVGAQQSVPCAVSAFGDPAPGFVKSCFVYPPNTQPSGQACANEGQTCSFTGLQMVWFGNGVSYISRPMSDRVDCTVGDFGIDPGPGPKSCFTTRVESTFAGPPGGFFFATTHNGVVMNQPFNRMIVNGVEGLVFETHALPAGEIRVCNLEAISGYLNSCFIYENSAGTMNLPPSYTYCAPDRGTCQFGGGPAYVAYGQGSQFRIKKAWNQINCTGSAFGDPNPSVVKACYFMRVSPGAP